MSGMSTLDLTIAINAVTSDWSVRGPFHESKNPWFSLVNGEWIGSLDGFETRLQALQAIYEAVKGNAGEGSNG
ncbi:Uncharacterised protein [Escherichia coli]|nr:Uncharacterised protein [Escherichia coli]